VYNMSNGDLRVADFVPFYCAGKIVLSGQAEHAYNYDVRMKISKELVAPHALAHPFLLQYPPFVFLLMTPFAALPLIPAYYLWCIFTVAFGVVSIHLFLYHHMRWQLQYIALLCLITLCSLVSVLNLYIGQVGWLLIGLNALFFWGLLANRDKMGGIALALTTIKPQYSIVYIGAVLGLRRWRLLAYALLTEMALFLSTALVLGWQTVSQYPQLLTHTETVDNTITCMTSVRPLLEMLLPHVLAIEINMVVLIMGIIGIMALFHANRNSIPPILNCMVAITVLTALIVSPHTHCHDLLLIALPAAMLPINILWKETDTGQWGKIWAVLISFFPFIGFLFFVMSNTGPWSRWPFFLYDVILLALACNFLRFLKNPNSSLKSSPGKQ